jgi:endonuclease YncB( thermonuclease family)
MGRSRIISLLLWVAGAALHSAGAAGAPAHSLQVSVIGIADGDTITVLDSNQLQHRVRLAGIDAPEKQQAFGERSRQSLSTRVYRKDVRLEWSKEDKYGRWVARVLLDPPTGCEPSCAAPVDVSLEQIRAGMAWHYKEYEREQSRPDREAYAQAELAARAAQAGLWADPNPVAPWEWRLLSRTGPP